LKLEIMAAWPIVWLASQPALAQQSAGADALQEIVVTATKRESTVETTPLSLTALSEAGIQEAGLTDLAEVAQSVPGLAMRSSGPGQTEFEIRGIASTGGNSPTVGFYFDDTPLTAPASTNNGKVVIDPNLYDLNRIEILRGPQGTLYGSGSMGGTIKLVPNAPDVTALGASGELVFGGTDGGGFNRTENAMVNLPLPGGTAALRIVVTESHDSGWIDRVVIANGKFPLETGNDLVRGNVLAAPVAADYKDVNDTELTAARISLLWKPIDRLSITPSFFYQEILQDGLSQIDSDPGTDAHYQPFDTPEPFSDRFTLESLNAQYGLDWFDISSTTSYWSRQELLRQDDAESWQWGLGLPSYYVGDGGVGAGPSLEQQKSRQASEELRLTSTTDWKLKWLVGYFFSNFESQWNDFLPAPGAVDLFGTGNLYSQVVPTKIRQNSVFGELTYDLTSRLQLTAGLRRYSYTETVNTAASGIVSPSGSNAVDYFYAAENNQGINPKFTLSYQATDGLLLYTTAAKGFRPGGGTGPIPTSGTVGSACELNLQAVYGRDSFVSSPNAFSPDTVWNYEAGEKLQALDRRLTINGAGYFENWEGVQQNVPLPCGYNFEANAGDAHIYGAELEINGALPMGLTLSGNVGYTHARIVSAGLANAGLEVGAPVQDVPEWTSSASATYRRPLTDDIRFMARVENNYVGSRTDSTYSINHLPAYDLTYFRSGIESDRWSAVFFANNVLNKTALLNNVTLLVINLPTYNRVAVSQPLTFGIDLNYRFGRRTP
jgi:iron complex outermembrane recepter protein